MLEIHTRENGEIVLSGRFDASQAGKADAVLEKVNGACTLDFKDLEYISSLGLGTLLKTQKRLKEVGGGLILVNVNKHIREIFRFSALDRVFEIHTASD